ncbi:hypothetical protein [Mycolicibacterium phlei]
MGARGYARYVGRVGALALALGVGVAVATPHIAVADPTPGVAPSAPDTTGSDTSGPDTGQETSFAPATVESAPDAGTSSAGTTMVDAGPSTGDANSGGSASATNTTTTVSVGNSPPVTYSSSGGALTSTDDDETGQLGTAAAADEPLTRLSETAESRLSALSTWRPTPRSTGGHDHDWLFDPVPPEDSWPEPVSRFQPLTNTTPADLTTELDNAMARPAPEFRDVPVPKVSPGPPSSTTTQAIVLPADAPRPDRSRLVRVVSGLLTAALGPLVGPGPEAPSPTPALWLLLAWARRQLPGQNPEVAGNAPAPTAGPALAAAHGSFTAEDAARSLVDDLVALFIRLTTGGLTVNLDNPFTIDDVDLRTGAVTGSVNVTGPDTTPLSFSLFDGPATGAVSVDPLTGKWTFTPTPVSRVQAVAVSGVEVAFAIIAGLGRAVTAPIMVTVPVHAAEAAAYPAMEGVPVSGVRLAPNDVGFQVIVRHDPGTATYETAVAIIDPASPSATVTAPVRGALSHFTFAPDHTAYSTTVLAHPDSDSYALTVIDASGASRTVPLAGAPAGAVVFGPDGHAYQTSYRQDPDADTYVTTVTIIEPDRHVEATLDGYPVAFGARDGIAYQVTESRPFATDEDGNETTVAAIDPTCGATTIAARLPGAALEFATAPDGTAFQIVRAVNGDRYDHTLTRIAEDGAVQTIPLPGAPVGALTFGADGTALLTVRPAGVVVVAPSGDVGVVALPASPRGAAQFGADGTARQTLRTGEVAVIDIARARIADTVTPTAARSVVGPDGTVYTHHSDGAAPSVIEIARPGSEPTAVEIDGHLFTAGQSSNAYSVMQGVRFAPDGTAYVISGTRQVQLNPVLGDYDGLVLTILSDGGATRLPLAGGDTGFLKYLSDSSFAYFAAAAADDGVATAVTFVDLAAGTADSIHLDGYFTDYTVGADGTAYVVTNTDFDAVSGTPGRQYTLTVASADGSLWTTDPIDGVPYDGLVAGPDGAVYQVVEGADGASTGVIVARPGSLTSVRINLDGYPQSPVVFDSAGIGYVTTGVVDAVDGELRTVVTVVAAPAPATADPRPVRPDPRPVLA